MAAREHQPQSFVFDFGVQCRRFVRRMFECRGNFRLFVAEYPFASQHIQRQIFRGLCEPCGGVFGNPVVGPRPQRPHERFLDHILGQLQSGDSEDSRQDGNKFPRLVTEKVFRQTGNLPVWR